MRGTPLGSTRCEANESVAGSRSYESTRRVDRNAVRTWSVEHAFDRQKSSSRQPAPSSGQSAPAISQQRSLYSSQRCRASAGTCLELSRDFRTCTWPTRSEGPAAPRVSTRLRRVLQSRSCLAALRPLRGDTLTPLILRELRMFAGKHPFSTGIEPFSWHGRPKKFATRTKRLTAELKASNPAGFAWHPRVPYAVGPVPPSNRRYCSGACQYLDTTQRRIDAWLFYDYNPRTPGKARFPSTSSATG